MNTFNSFKDLNLCAPLTKSLEKMGFVTPTAVQAQSIPAALEGKDVLGTAQTGTGKTGAFGIPMLNHLYKDNQIQALVLAPTRELAAQIHQVLKKMFPDMYGVLLVGGESFGRQVREVHRGFDYLVATPGRLNDHLEQRTVSLAKVKILVLDEVDRMLDMGFLPQIRQALKSVPPVRQTLLFSATLPRELENLVATFLKNPVRVSVTPTVQQAAQVKEETMQATHQEKNSLLLKAMQERTGKILVFTKTQFRTERLANILDREGHKVVALHGGRSPYQRREALERFKKGSHPIMVATDLAGRGIDVVDIEHVINYDMPSTKEDYIHRIGRTGRNGKTGFALNLVVPGDTDYSKPKGKPQPSFSKKRFSPRRRQNRVYRAY